MRKLVAALMRQVAPPPATRPQRPHPHGVVALQRDPWCGTYVSPEISFPLEQQGQVLHFCSAACRARYAQASNRAASA